IERIIQRATELQAGERDIGDGLTEGELLQLARDVGIPDAYVRQAMLEERTKGALPDERGVVATIVGPRFVAAARALPGEAHRVETALHQWMADGELLAVKRRYPEQTSWEPKQGAMASIRRALSFGGRSYALTRAREVVGQVIPLDTGRCHVRLVADLKNTQQERMAAAAAAVIAGAAAAGVGLVLGVALPVLILPAVLGTLVAWLVARNRRKDVERVHVTL